MILSLGERNVAFVELENQQPTGPVLINAMKEQQSETNKLKEQETKYIEQAQRLERLEGLVAQLN